MPIIVIKMGKLPFLFCLLLFPLIFSGNQDRERNKSSTMNYSGKGLIGVIVDMNSRIGKEEILAMQMAVEEFNSDSNRNFSLVIKDSKSDINLAALAAKDLINVQQVQVVIGPQTWEMASVVAEFGNENQIPVLALANEIPKSANERFKFLVQASPSQSNQMRAIAGIISSWDWHLVNVIYEDSDLSTMGIFSDLVHALKDVGAEVSEFVGLSQYDSDLFFKELERLRRGSSRIFVVHMSFKLALRLFETAKEMGMMGKDYVWITTDSFTSLAYSFNVSINSVLQGVVGVKSFIPEDNTSFHQFYLRFARRFRLEHSDEDNHEPGIYAVQAYDAARTATMAMSEIHGNGSQLLEKIMLTSFQGLGGKIQFKDRKLALADNYQIINVMGRSYRELGFWSDKLGFSRELMENSSSSLSMKDLGQVFWPGGSSETPRGWVVPTDAGPLKIGVPTRCMFKEYLNVVKDHTGNKSNFCGLAIDLFNEALKKLPFPPYEFYPFDGSYDDLVREIYLKKYDAAVGDIAIITQRLEYVDFTHPYSEAGLVMIVPAREDTCSRPFLLTKPFTTKMWILIVVLTVYNGFVVWFIERNHYPKREGSMFNQAGAFICVSFITLFSLHGKEMHSNLSRMAMVAWLFMALVLTQTYTANLTSMLTVQKLEATITNIETLRKANASVGYARGTFVQRYVEVVLQLNTKEYATQDDLVKALRNKEILAAFLEVPFAKLFLARFCKDFMISGPIYKVGGFGFAFPRGSLLLRDVNKALLEISESGKYRELEEGMLAREKCVDGEAKDESPSLGPSPFYLLFVWSGGISTIAFTLYIITTHKSYLQQNILWRLMLVVIKSSWRNRRRKGFDLPQTVQNNFPNATNLQIQV